MIRDQNGHFVIAGEIFTSHGGKFNFLFLKIDSDGNLLFRYDFGTPDKERAGFIHNTLDNGYLLVGTSTTDDNRDNDVFVVKTDNDGALEFQASYGDSIYWQVGRYGIQLDDGSLLICGETGTAANGNDVYLIKTNPGSTSVEPKDDHAITLTQNYPNPFSSSTKIT